WTSPSRWIGSPRATGPWTNGAPSRRCCGLSRPKEPHGSPIEETDGEGVGARRSVRLRTSGSRLNDGQPLRDEVHTPGLQRHDQAELLGHLVVFITSTWPRVEVPLCAPRPAVWAQCWQPRARMLTGAVASIGVLRAGPPRQRVALGSVVDIDPERRN